MSINQMQKKLIVIGIALFILMSLFPPWTYTYKYESIYSEEPTGYGFIFSPPNKKLPYAVHGIKIDMSRLFIQWVIVLAATGIGIYLTSTKE